MNHYNLPHFIPVTPAPPIDLTQVVSFASAGAADFVRINNTLGISLDTGQYRKLQFLFYNVEKRNPSFGELRLLASLINRASLAERAAPGELYTDSEAVMDTWADIIYGYRSTYGDTVEPCTLAHVMALSEAYHKETALGAIKKADVRLTTVRNAPKALSMGYRPMATIQTANGITRQLWRRKHAPEEPLPGVGDVILVLPPTEIKAICAFLDEYPTASEIRAISAVKDTSLMMAALTLCRGWGLEVTLETLIPPSASIGTAIQAYLDTWETDAPDGSAYLLLRISPTVQAELFTALAAHGFAPRVMGVISKKTDLTIFHSGTSLVCLKEESVTSAGAARFYSCQLPTPSPLGAARNHAVVNYPLTYSAETKCTFSESCVTLGGKAPDGFTSSAQSVLSLAGQFAAAGILYNRLKLSPILFMKGNAESPLLLSAVCGLYRAASELGILITSPEILFKRRDADEDCDSLTISLMMYTDTPPMPTLSSQTVTEQQPLHLFTLGEAPQWNDVRHLLFAIAQAVAHGTALAAYCPEGDPVLDCLSRLTPAETGIRTELFEENKELLSSINPFSFILEGEAPKGGLHIGNTGLYSPDTASSEKAPPPPSLAVTPYPTVTLSTLKDKETQRRKEIAAMEKIKAFEPLCKTPRTVLLDTDIGPDCDDVGALAVLIYYAKQYGFSIGGICNCTSNKAGNGVIDAVCRRCGIDTPPLGQWHGEGFMDSPEHCKYNTAVAEAHSEAYRNGTLPVDDEVTFYRKRLAAAKDGEVMVISIGMFNNLAALLDSPADDISPLTGVELVKAKVYALVSMAAILPQGRECNVVSDYKSAEKVFANWPTAIYLSDFHIGVNVKTGYGHVTDPETIMADPLPMSYHLYTKEWNWEGAIIGQNASYDLTAVQFAALGEGELYGLDTPGDLEFYAEIPELPDATRFVPNPMGNKIFMTKKVADEVIADSLQKILVSF